MLRVNPLMALKLVLIGIPVKLGKLVLIHQIQLALSLPLLLALYLAFEKIDFTLIHQHPLPEGIASLTACSYSCPETSTSFLSSMILLGENPRGRSSFN